MKLTKTQLQEMIKDEMLFLSEKSSVFRDSWRGVTKRDAIELAKKNNLKFVQDKQNTRYWYAFRPGAKQAIFKWDEEWDELISDYSPMELRMRRVAEENKLQEATFVFHYDDGKGRFAHQLKAMRLKDAMKTFIDMYKIPKSEWDKILVHKTKGIFGI